MERRGEQPPAQTLDTALEARGAADEFDEGLPDDVTGQFVLTASRPQKPEQGVGQRLVGSMDGSLVTMSQARHQLISQRGRSTRSHCQQPRTGRQEPEVADRPTCPAEPGERLEHGVGLGHRRQIGAEPHCWGSPTNSGCRPRRCRRLPLKRPCGLPGLARRRHEVDARTGSRPARTGRVTRRGGPAPRPRGRARRVALRQRSPLAWLAPGGRPGRCRRASPPA